MARLTENKKVKFLGFDYSRVGDVAMLKFLNRSVYCRIGRAFCLFGYFGFN